MNKSAIPSAFTPSDASHLQVIAQAAAAALVQLQQLRSARRSVASLTSLARCMPLLASCDSASAVAEYVGRTLPTLLHARSARLLLTNRQNSDMTSWRVVSSGDGVDEPPLQLRVPCKSMWGLALRSVAPTIVNDTRGDARFGRGCSFASVMLVPIHSTDALSDKDEFGSHVTIQGCEDSVVVLGLIEIKDKLSPAGFSPMDALVVENCSKVVASLLQREDVRMYMPPPPALCFLTI